MWQRPFSLPLSALALAAAALAAPAAQAAEGVVRKLLPAQAKVTLAHGPLPELGMPAMTMTYRVESAALLQGLAVDDRVEFSARKVDGQYVVITIEKKRP